MRVIHIYITFLLLSLPILGQAQTYIQGEDFLPFSQAATSKYLTSKTQISLEEAFTKLKQIEGDEFKKTLPQLRGEYYIVEGMLASLSCFELADLYKRKYKGIYDLYLYSTHSVGPEYWHLMYKDLGEHQILISYPKKGQSLFYHIENDTYTIMGGIHIPMDKINEAQEFIEKLVESITFKN